MIPDPLAAPPFPRLAALAEAGRLPPSLLFSGPPGAPTVAAAIRLAAQVNGPDGRPDTAAARHLEERIRQVDPARPKPEETAAKAPRKGRGAVAAEVGAVHPFLDVVIVRPDGVSTRVGNLKQAIAASRAHPLEGRKRFLIVAEAETMNPAAANALLKTLEEPHPCLSVVLCAGGEGGLLPTIVSRCQRWRFRSLTLAETTARLREEHGYAEDEAEAAAFAAGGDPETALALPRDRLLGLREDAVRIAAVAARGIRPAERADLLSRLAAPGPRAAGAADDLRPLLALLRTELRDLAAVSAGAPTLAAADGDSGTESSRLRAETAALAPPRAFAEALLEVEEADRRLTAFYGNRRMQLDGLLLAFNEIARPLVVARRRGGRI